MSFTPSATRNPWKISCQTNVFQVISTKPRKLFLILELQWFKKRTLALETLMDGSFYLVSQNPISRIGYLGNETYACDRIGFCNDNLWRDHELQIHRFDTIKSLQKYIRWDRFFSIYSTFGNEQLIPTHLWWYVTRTTSHILIPRNPIFCRD